MDRDNELEKELLVPALITSTATTADVVVFAPADTGETHVLLGLRGISSDAYPGYWSLPGGYRNTKEDTRTTAVREAKEETDVTLTAADLVAVGHYATPGRDPRGPVTSDAYTVHLAAAIAVTGHDDFDAAKWVPVVKALRTDLAFDHNTILRDALRCPLC